MSSPGTPAATPIATLGAQFPSAATAAAWSGLHGSAAALAIVEAAARAQGPAIVLAAGSREADRLAAELRFFAPVDLPVHTFPDYETLPYDPFSPHPDLTSQRLTTLAALPGLRRGIVLVTVEALLQRLPPRQYVESHSFVLAAGQKIDVEAFRGRLTAAGYAAVTQVMAHGEFAVRGSIIDLFPMGAREPYRIDLFDDEVESIRIFDPESQRSGEKLPQVRLLPAREFPTTPEAVKEFRRRWRVRFEGDPLRSPVYRAVSEGLAPAGIEYWLPLFFERTASLFDYLPARATLIASGLDASIEAAWAGISARYDQLGHDIERPLLKPGEVYLEAHELANEFGRRARIALGTA
ncbi:MAG: transcription-repair coupling factor, partial [Gammaproteobacteria bacterium]|nr:transcription-repair coupling factor [Gammaproteobacteria bacterium]